MVTPFMHPGPRTLRRAAGGGELSPRLKRHLAACDQCRARVGFMRDLIRQTRALEGPVASDALRQRIRARVEAGDRVILPEADPRRARRGTPKWIAAAVAAVLVGLWMKGTRELRYAPAAAGSEMAAASADSAAPVAVQESVPVRVLALSSALSRTEMTSLRRVTDRLARRGIAVQTVSAPPSDTFPYLARAVLADSAAPVAYRESRRYGYSTPETAPYYVLDRLGRVVYSGSDPEAVFDRAVALSQGTP